MIGQAALKHVGKIERIHLVREAGLPPVSVLLQVGLVKSVSHEPGWQLAG